MNTVILIFNERVREIELYYNFLKANLNNRSEIELYKILRSNLILMLYNMVESTISNAIEEIHNNMHVNNTTFDSLNFELKKVLIKQLKNNINPHDFVQSINNLATDIVKQCFQKRKISNGNIDNDTISKLGRDYGFNIRTTYEETKNGKCLEVIRGRRNDLAHGTFSFTEIGKEYTIEDLGLMKDEAINYLNQILQNISVYLNNQNYKLKVINN